VTLFPFVMLQEEVQYFKKHLVNMFAAMKPVQKCVFLETVYDLGRQRHTIIECIPLPKELYDDAEMYFVKALNEADEEWAQHKKIIRFSNEKGGIRRAVPSNFAYFSVEVRNTPRKAANNSAVLAFSRWPASAFLHLPVWYR
jgi:hypothetical protein